MLDRHHLRLAFLVPLALAMVLACDRNPADDDDTTEPAEPRIEALLGDEGVALFVAGASTDAVVEATASDLAVYDVPLAGSTVVIDDRGTADTDYRLVDGNLTVAECGVSALTVGATVEPDPAVLLAGESVTVELSLGEVELSMATGDLGLRRTLLPDGAVTWLDPACLDSVPDEGCWLDEATPLVERADPDALAAFDPITVPDHASPHTEPTAEALDLVLRVVDDGGAVLHAGGGARVVFVGAALRWGDPHAHSNLSHDGCEDADAACANRADAPGEDFFANAVAEGLDFAAMTEHGEWHEIRVEDATEWWIWDESLARVDAALAYEDQGFVPLLGYEWTAYINPFDVLEEGDDPEDFAGSFVRGHKTVLFREPWACDAWCVGANTMMDEFAKGETGLVYHRLEDRIEALTVAGLHDYWDDAADECGDTDLLTYFHHPAYVFPSPVNWALPGNIPDVGVEMLVEIASEHGSSECRDTAQDGCGFWLNEDGISEHVSWGSVQEALALGYRLGFVGGTDSHDARPGSLDEASTIAAFWDADGDGVVDDPQQQFAPGTITGVWIGGDWSRDTLWEGLTARHTLATTGPQGRVVMAALDAEGDVYLPGDVVPAVRFPVEFVAVVEPGDGWEVEQLELVDPVDGAVVASTTATTLTLELAHPGSPALYLRARLWDGDAEHRLWLSPLFVGS